MYVVGFEIAISYENETSCIQLIEFSLDSSISYRLRLKDPTFVTIYKKEYTFYFGRISLRPIIKCTRSLEHCAASNWQTAKLDVGIRSLERGENSSSSDISFEPDLCQGHLINQICSQKYRETRSFIIMHSMPSGFNRVLASLEAEPRYMVAKHKKNLSEDGIRDYIFDEAIESTHHEKLPNQLVLKLVNFQKEDIYYGVRLFFFFFLK